MDIWIRTVDGRNPASVDSYFIPLFTGFYVSQVVVWDFFHQQYVIIMCAELVAGCCWNISYIYFGCKVNG